MAGSPPVSDDPPPAQQAIVDANASFEPSPGAASFCGFKLPFFKFSFGLHLPPLPIPFPLPKFSFSIGLSCDPLGIDASGNTSANCFFQELEVYASASATGTVYGIDLNTPNTYLGKVTVACSGNASVVTRGINIFQSQVVLWNVHMEGCASGVYISGNSSAVLGFTIEAGTNGAVRPVTTLIDDQSTSVCTFFNVIKNAATTTWAQSSYGTSSTDATITSTLGATAAPKAATLPSVTASPYQYHNTSPTNQVVAITGGTMSVLSMARQGVTAALAIPSSVIVLAPGDLINITYTVAPVLTVYPAG